MVRLAVPETTDGIQAPRRGGRFAKGQSGNPAGRPKGARNKVTARCIELLGDASDEIVAKLIKMAKAGDAVALRLAVERLVPIRAARDRAVECTLPDVSKVADLAAAAAAVIHHAALGDITLSEAREFMLLLEGQRNLIETTDLAVRLEALEGDAGIYAETPARPGGEEVAARVRKLLEDRRAVEERRCG